LTAYGDRLEIPAGALSADTAITVAVSPNDQSGQGVIALPRKYHFGPSGTTFSVPATAKFAYKTSDLQGADPNTIKVYVWDSATSTWTASGGTADASNRTISIGLNHFSDYALFGGEPTLNFPVLAASYIYKTPITFRFSAFNPSVVTNVAGFLNDRLITSDTTVALTKLGSNIFKVIGTKTDGAVVSQEIVFDVDYSLKWLSPLASESINAGSVLPIKFAAKDFNGNFVEDANVAVEIFDETGHQTEIFTSDGVKISESHYLLNLDTSRYFWILPGGKYRIEVTFGPVSYHYSFTTF
jgi:hypothetical protein